MSVICVRLKSIWRMPVSGVDLRLLDHRQDQHSPAVHGLAVPVRNVGGRKASVLCVIVAQSELNLIQRTLRTDSDRCLSRGANSHSEHNAKADQEQHAGANGNSLHSRQPTPLSAARLVPDRHVSPHSRRAPFCPDRY
jgi:hypothetical protein